jgi:hypothetical protein
MIDSLQFYTTPGLMTSPRDHSEMFDNLPCDLASLCKVVQGAMIHVFWADQYGVQLDESRRGEVQLRAVARKLPRILELDGRPLVEIREPAKRLVGNCRDFSVLLTAILRHQGVPARARCGFGRYFLPNRYVDHWVCEYWNRDQNRWVLVDAQLDDYQYGKLKVPFSPLDVPRDQFIVAGKAWHLCRTAQADPNAFGIFDMKGLWFVRGNLVRDVAALNNMELLPWDCWGIAETKEDELSADDFALLDRAAELTCGDVPEFAQVRMLYENDNRLRVAQVIRSYTDDGPQAVDLKDI